MSRTAYLASLVVLQLALMSEVTPQVAEFIRVHSAILHAWDAPTAMLRMVVAGIAMLGATIVLAAPGLAFLRHHQRGGLRFLGLPSWAVCCAVAGALLFMLAFVAPHGFAFLAGAGVDTWAAVEQSVRDAAIAMMAGGAIGAELLRRSVAPPQLLRECMPIRHVHVEVVHPDDLRTRAA
jgi:hypothetical protein